MSTGRDAGFEARRARFEALYTRHHAAVRRYVARRAPAAEVDDAVSETFLVVWRRLDAVPGEEIPWLLGVARRVLANHRRGHGRHDRLVERLAAEPVAPGAEPPSVDPEELRAALARLPELDREVLRLVYWDELDATRAARVLDRSPGAVRVRLHRARARLRQALPDGGLGGLLAPLGKLGGAAPVAVLSVAMVGAPAILTGDGTVLSERTIGPGDPAPRTRGLNQPRGSPLPRDQAFVEATVRLPAGQPERYRWHRLTLTCPKGFVQAGSLSAGGGPRSIGALRSVGIWTGSQRTAGRSRRGVIVFRPRPRLDRPVTARMGIVCMTPASYWPRKRASMRQACAMYRAEERERRAAGRRQDPRLTRARRFNCRWRSVGR